MSEPRIVHHVGDPVLVHKRLTPAEQRELLGVKVTYEVIRNGARVHRTGFIDRFDERFVSISGWIYWLEGELHNLRRA